jgi:hypothetical protein
MRKLEVAKIGAFANQLTTLQAMLRIRIPLMRIQKRMRNPDPLSLCADPDLNPDPACHFVADPDPTFQFNADPSFQIQAINLEKVLK